MTNSGHGFSEGSEVPLTEAKRIEKSAEDYWYDFSNRSGAITEANFKSAIRRCQHDNDYQLKQRDSEIQALKQQNAQLVIEKISDESKIEIASLEIQALRKENETLAEAYQSIGRQWDKSEDEVKQLREALKSLLPLAEQYVYYIGYLPQFTPDECDRLAKAHSEEIEEASKLLNKPSEKPK